MLYYLAASALGVGWAAVLSVPRLTGGFVRQLPNWNVALLILTSVVIARLFKSWISEGGNLGDHIRRALVITYVGCAVYLTLFNLFAEANHLLLGSPLRFEEWLPRYFWGTIATLSACYAVVPYGIFCQLAMNQVSRLNAGNRNRVY